MQLPRSPHRPADSSPLPSHPRRGILLTMTKERKESILEKNDDKTLFQAGRNRCVSVPPVKRFLINRSHKAHSRRPPMVTRTRWTFCLYLFLVALSPSGLRADPITSFWFEFEHSEEVGPFSIDIPITSLGDGFFGPLPVFDQDMTTQLFPAAEIFLETSNFLICFDPVAAGGEPCGEDFSSPEPFHEGSNLYTADDSLASCGIPTLCPQLFYNVQITAHHGDPTLESVSEPATSVLLLSGLVMGGLAKRKRARENRR